jgi:hypothetical protein
MLLTGFRDTRQSLAVVALLSMSEPTRVLFHNKTQGKQWKLQLLGFATYKLCC